jgi:cystathionine gamma-lyase
MVALTNGSSTTHTNGINGIHTNGVHSNGVTNGVHKSDEASWGFATRAVHVGSEPSTETGAVIPPISLSTTFKQDGVGIHKVTQLR